VEALLPFVILSEAKDLCIVMQCRFLLRDLQTCRSYFVTWVTDD
jgi:hypothetical protein